MTHITKNPVRQPDHRNDDLQEAMYHAAIDGKAALTTMLGDISSEDSTELIVEKLTAALEKARFVKKCEKVRAQRDIVIVKQP